MSQNRHAEGLRAVETFWQVRLPESFCNLYSHFPTPFLAPCEFFALDAIAMGVGREFGMIPQFLPFGRAVGEGGVYGFYMTPETGQGMWPVLYWDEDEMFLRPVSSDFEAFLRHCVLVGRYETEGQWPDGVTDPQEEEERREFARLLTLPSDLLFGPLPRNDTELHESLVRSDLQDAVSLCHLGCTRRAQGDAERALDFYHRASEAATWFGDPTYLLGDLYRVRGNYERAVQNWWNTVRCLLPLCTRTWAWDLGFDYPEADIYEIAADALRQYEKYADASLKAQPLWHLVVQEEPYNAEEREALGHLLLQQNDVPGAEREFLNALSLCSSDANGQPERLYTSLLDLYERSGRKRDAALIRHDRSLPRPAL